MINSKIFKLEPETDFMKEIAKFCRANKISAGWLQAVGAMKNVKLAHFDPKGKKFSEITLNKQLEIASLSGTISICRGEIHFHLHSIFSDNQFKTYGGHLKSAFVSPTVEVIIWQYDKKLTRAYDRKIGLDILE